MKCKYCQTEECTNYDVNTDVHAKCPVCTAPITPNGVCVNNGCNNNQPLELRPKPQEIPNLLESASISQ